MNGLDDSILDDAERNGLDENELIDAVQQHFFTHFQLSSKPFYSYIFLLIFIFNTFYLRRMPVISISSFIRL